MRLSIKSYQHSSLGLGINSNTVILWIFW